MPCERCSADLGAAVVRVISTYPDGQEVKRELLGIPRCPACGWQRCEQRLSELASVAHHRATGHSVSCAADQGVCIDCAWSTDGRLGLYALGVIGAFIASPRGDA